MPRLVSLVFILRSKLNLKVEENAHHFPQLNCLQQAGIISTSFPPLQKLAGHLGRSRSANACASEIRSVGVSLRFIESHFSQNTRSFRVSTCFHMFPHVSTCFHIHFGFGTEINRDQQRSHGMISGGGSSAWHMIRGLHGPGQPRDTQRKPAMTAMTPGDQPSPC